MPERGRPKGQPKTGGRQKGTLNKATAKRETELRKSGILPLDYMLKVLRDRRSKPDDKRWAAQTAAPYVHPKLAAVEHSGDVTVRHEDAIEDLE